MKYLVILAILFFTLKGSAQVPPPKVDPIHKRLIFDSKSHLNKVIEFYTKNDDDTPLINLVTNLENRGFRSLYNENLNAEQYKQSGSQGVYDIEDDAIIGDDRFGRLLNRQREVVIGGSIYKYEDDGLYFTSGASESHLSKKMLSKKASNTSLTSYPSQMIDGHKIYDLGDGVKYFNFDYHNSISYEDNYNLSGKSNTTKFEPSYQLENCNFDDSGFFESFLGGSSEVCIVNIDNNKRIRTKFSNQNYLIYSSVYAKIKTQKKGKFLGITTWKRDNFCEYIEMGRTVVVKYPIEYPTPSTRIHNFVIKDNNFNRVLDINGNTINTTPINTVNVFDQFPFDDSYFNFEIYYYIGTYNPTSKDINKMIANGVEGLLKSLGKSFDDLFSKNDKTKVGMTIDTPGGIYFTEFGEKERKYGSSRISKTYDYNFNLKLSSSLESFFGDLIDSIDFGTFINAKNYEILSLDVYGLGNYNGNIYGSRIHKGDLRDENSNALDSDGDGVPDHEDFCKFQKGFKNYGGCPYALIDDQSLFANRINEHIDTRTQKSTTNTQSFGACYNLELKSSDFPSVINQIQGGKASRYEIVAGKKIIIKGPSKIRIKPTGSTSSIVLRTSFNACQITPIPEHVQSAKSFTDDSQKSIREVDISKVEINPIELYPNPTKNSVRITSIKEIHSWHLYNTLGVIYNQNENLNSTTTSIDLGTYPIGMYLLKLTLQDGQTVTKQIIKQ